MIANLPISAVFESVFCLPHDSGGVLLFHVFLFYHAADFFQNK